LQYLLLECFSLDNCPLFKEDAIREKELSQKISSIEINSPAKLLLAKFAKVRVAVVVVIAGLD
jgi:hypothetical protein